jgi:DNA-binding CsgD family transcriptional regulator
VSVLCRTALCALALVDDSRRYVRVNEGTEELLGAPRKTILERRIDQFTFPENLADLELFWATLERDGELTGTGVLMRGDGTRAHAEFRAHWSFAPHRHLLALREVRLPARQRAASEGGMPRLTAREQEVLQLSAEGFSTDEIAGQLVVSAGTIKTHLHHIYGKLGARDRVSAVAIALRHGFIS